LCRYGGVLVFYDLNLPAGVEKAFLCAQVAKEYCEQLGVDACIKIFEQFRSYEGLYFFLGSYLSSR